MKEQYNLLVFELKKIKLKPSEKIIVHRLEQEIIIETHKDSSQRFDNRVYSASRKVGGLVWGKNVSACGGLSGYDIIDSVKI